MDYTRNVCKYRDLPRFYYSSMVSAMDDAIGQVLTMTTGVYFCILVENPIPCFLIGQK
jgi:hypothetical protein